MRMGGEMTANDLTEFYDCLSVAFSRYGVDSLTMNSILPDDVNFPSAWLSLNLGPTNFWVESPRKQKNCSVNYWVVRNEAHRVRKLFFHTTLLKKS
jgi:hypothetical protein